MPNPNDSPNVPKLPVADNTNAKVTVPSSSASVALAPASAPVVPKKAIPRPQRGDIYWVNIPKQHIVGHEQYKRRPWLIVSNNAIAPLDIVIGVPLSFQIHKKNRQFRIAIPATEIIHEVGCSRPLDPGERIALTEQVR